MNSLPCLDHVDDFNQANRSNDKSMLSPVLA